MPLVLTHAEAQIPVTQVSGDSWDALVDARRCAPDVSPYEGLMNLLEGELHRSCLSDDASTVSASRRPARHDTAFSPVSDGPTQADMALDVVARLRERLDACDVNSVPNLMTYASTAVDEDFFASVTGRIAAANKISKSSHFGVWQMQGAAFTASLEVAEATLHEPGDTAFLVASEKWPLPADRKTPVGGLLGDGACAVRASFYDNNEADYSGLIVRATRNVSMNPLVNGSGSCSDVDMIISKVCEEAVRLLDIHPDIDPDTLVWLPSGFGADADMAVASRVGGKVGASASEYGLNTDFCCASGHLAVSRILDSMPQTSDSSDGQYFVHWGVSFGGALAIAFLQLKISVKP